ncbi:MAG: Serine/threonine-protein phosphatase 2A activator 2 [Alyxoria varia]|nr:MAG: Serine/threonine-protein phosphatase 2A activator 2 [Alyxoria varia]
MPIATDAGQARQPLPDSAIPQNPPDLSKKLPPLGLPKPRTRTTTKKPSNPPVETPKLATPPPRAQLRFAHPRKRILTPHDHDLFLSSPTHQLIVSFAFNVADSVRDTTRSYVANQPLHPTVRAVLAILDRAEETVKQCPVDDNNGSRFGNPAFRTFISAVTENCTGWHRAESALNIQSYNQGDGLVDELTTYFSNSFGSSTRIDYGSGHELNFLVYLLCLYQISLLPKDTFPSLALVVFPKYLELMRSLQETYYLEPAGSHGVWGLDDYHFLPFLFGASQLADHQFIRPLAIHSSSIIDSYAEDFLYLDMVRHVNETKNIQGLRWHSPMLDDISGVKEGWWKISDGMKRMFVHEVVGKLVVMQHFLFGGLIPAGEDMSQLQDEEYKASDSSTPEHGHDTSAHGHDQHTNSSHSWGDCCGIKVPSSIGASREINKHGASQGLRPLPFD